MHFEGTYVSLVLSHFTKWFGSFEHETNQAPSSAAFAPFRILAVKLWVCRERVGHGPGQGLGTAVTGNAQNAPSLKPSASMPKA
jgi:hypothetical protein